MPPQSELSQASVPTPPPVEQMSLSVGDFVRSSWQTFKKRPWFLVGSVILFYIISSIASFVAGLSSVLVEPFFGSVIGSIVAFACGIVVNSVVAMGWIAFFLKANDDIDAVRINDFWHPQPLISYIAVTILYALIVIVGFLLLVVPGVIAAVTFFFAPYLVVDRGLGPIAALKESARITKNNRWRVLALMGATVLVMFLGILALVVGLLVAAPIVFLICAHAYRSLWSAAASGVQQPLSGGEKAFVAAGMLLPTLVVLGLLSSVVLASLSSAREQLNFTSIQSNTRMAQLGVELYREMHGSYPATLDEMMQDPDIWSESMFSANDFAYTPVGSDSYSLCWTQPLYCATPETLVLPSLAQ